MPIPKWKETPTPVAIETLRDLTAAHGQSVSVLVTWHPTDNYNFVTIGCDKAYADAAVRLRDAMAKNLGIESLGIDRDLRHEHPALQFSPDQTDFLLWTLGYMRGAAEKLDEKHRTYVLKYHDELISMIASEKSKNEEKSPDTDSAGSAPRKRRNRVSRRSTPPGGT